MGINLDTFVLVGRVSEEENILVFEKAKGEEEAIAKFVERVKVHQDWDGTADVFIDFCIPLNESIDQYIYSESFSGRIVCSE